MLDLLQQGVRAILMLKAKKISEQPYMVLTGNPPRWHKFDPAKHAGADHHHSVHQATHADAVKKLAKQNPDFAQMPVEHQKQAILGHVENEKATAYRRFWAKKMALGKPAQKAEHAAVMAAPLEVLAPFLADAFAKMHAAGVGSMAQFEEAVARLGADSLEAHKATSAFKAKLAEKGVLSAWEAHSGAKPVEAAAAKPEPEKPAEAAAVAPEPAKAEPPKAEAPQEPTGADVDALMKLPKDKAAAKIKEWQETFGVEKVLKLLQGKLDEAKAKNAPMPAAPKPAAVKKPAEPVKEFAVGDTVAGLDHAKLKPGTVVQLFSGGKPWRKALVGHSRIWFEKLKGGAGWQKNAISDQHSGWFKSGEYGESKVLEVGGDDWMAPAQKATVAEILKVKQKSDFSAESKVYRMGASVVVGVIGKPHTFAWVDEVGAWGAGFSGAQQSKLADGAGLKELNVADLLDGDKPAAAEQPGIDPTTPVPAKVKKMIDANAEAGEVAILQAVAANNKTTNPHIAEYAQAKLDAMSNAKPADEGPKEGETKEGADGALVFKDGRWHKQGGEEPAGPKVEPVSQALAAAAAENPAPAAEDAQALKDKLQMLHDLLKEKPDSPNVPAWKAKIAEIEAKVGPLKTEKSAPAKPTVDTSSWGAPAKAAFALKQEYEALDKLDKKAVGAFKTKLRALAKKTPEDDQKATMLLDGLATKVWGTDYDPKVMGIEFAPAGASEPSGLEIKTFTHSKKGHTVYAVPLPKKLGDAEYKAVAATAKSNGGHYSSFKADGAIPGFHFKSEEQAQAFIAAAGGVVSGGVPAEAPAAAEPAVAEPPTLEGAVAAAGYAVKESKGAAFLAKKGAGYLLTFGSLTAANNAVKKLAAQGVDAHVTAAFPHTVVLNGLGAKVEDAPKVVDAEARALPESDVMTAGGNLVSAKATKGANPVWYTQTNPQIHAFNGSEGHSEIQVAKAAGYKPYYFKFSGAIQGGYLLIKDGKVLTEKGMAALLAGKPEGAPAELAPDQKAALDTIAAGPGAEHLLTSIANQPLGGNEAAAAYAAELLKKVGGASAPAPSEEGPHEGDTKIVDGTTYMLKNGRWHKVGDDAPADDEPKVPEKPVGLSSASWKNFADDIEQAIKEADVAEIYFGIANSEGLSSEDAKKVHAYATAALAYLKAKLDDPAAEPASDLKAKLDAVPLPNLSGFKNPSNVALALDNLKAAVIEQGPDAFKGVLKKMSKTGKLITKLPLSDVKTMTITGYVDSPDAPHSQVHKYVEALKEAAKGGAGKAPKKAKPKAEAGSGAPAATGMASQVKMVGSLGVTVADGWEQTGPQGGSNEGGRFKDGFGVEWYCKFPQSEDHAKNELLAAKFYEMLGVAVPSLKLIEKDGKIGIASKWVDGIKKASAADLAATPGAHDGFVLDAWLSNWDVVGLSMDNLMVGKDGKAVRVDVGGSLLYRAQGEPKGSAFGAEVAELETLLDPTKNGQSHAVFKSISKEAMQAGAEQLNKLKPSQIRELVEIAGPGDADAKKALADTLIKRRSFILAKFGIKDQWRPKVIDEAALEVNAADLPPPIDFANFNGPGAGLSSSAKVNEQNTKDSAALIAFAAQGNLKALKDYHYDAINKSTGEFVGKKSILEHPSKHVKEQWAGLVELLSSIAYPPVESLDMPALGSASTWGEVSAAVSYFPPEDRVETVTAEHRMGFFMKLGAVDGVQELVKSTSWSWLTPSSKFVIDMKAGFDKISSAVKAYISEVQASGWINHIWSQGKTEVSASGNGGSYSGGVFGLSAKIHGDAQEIPEGTQLWRWMADTTAGGGMSKQLLDAKPGTVIQNTNSMCCSYSESWGNNPKFGGGSAHPVLMRIRCPKGAKGTASFASGSFGKEYEITTLPGARFVVVETKKGVPGNPNGVLLDVVMLPPDDGYLSHLASLEALGKSMFVFLLKGRAK